MSSAGQLPVLREKAYFVGPVDSEMANSSINNYYREQALRYPPNTTILDAGELEENVARCTCSLDRILY